MKSGLEGHRYSILYILSHILMPKLNFSLSAHVSTKENRVHTDRYISRHKKGTISDASTSIFELNTTTSKTCWRRDSLAYAKQQLSQKGLISVYSMNYKILYSVVSIKIDILGLKI